MARATLHQLSSEWQVQMEIFFMMVNFMQLYVVSYVVRMQLDMLDNDNIMTVNAFEVVQKMPTDQKDCHKCSLYGIVSI